MVFDFLRRTGQGPEVASAPEAKASATGRVVAHLNGGRVAWPVAYEYAVGGRKHRFGVTGAISPICHVKAFHPQDDHYGFQRQTARPVLRLQACGR